MMPQNFHDPFSIFQYDPRPREVFLYHPRYPAMWWFGLRGSAKSTGLDWSLEDYYAHGYLPLDLWGTPDFENAFSCVPDLVKIFSWRMVPGRQEEKVRNYLKNRFGLAWLQQAQLSKVDDDKSILFTDAPSNKSLMLKLVKKDNQVDMIINDKKIWDFVVRKVEVKDQGTVRLVHDINPKRRDWWRVRKVGYPGLIIKPTSTEITPSHWELCRCGIPIRDHDSGKEIPCKLKPGDPAQPLIKPIDDGVSVEAMLNSAISEKRWVVLNRGFYPDHRYAYLKLAEIMHELPYLILQDRIPQTPIVMALREMSTLAPQGMKHNEGRWETATKREIMTLIKDARHWGITLLGDMQRTSDLMKSVAAQRDRKVYKRTTFDLMPEEDHALYYDIEQRRRAAWEMRDYATLQSLPSMSALKQYQAYIVYEDNHYQLIETMLPTFHHKETGDKWSRWAGVRIKIQPMTRGGKKAKDQKEKLQKKLDAEKAWYQKMMWVAEKKGGGMAWPDIFKDYGDEYGYDYATLGAMQADYYRARKKWQFKEKKALR